MFIYNREEDIIARQRGKNAKGRSASAGGGGGISNGNHSNRPEPPQMQFGDVDFTDEEYSSGDSD